IHQSVWSASARTRRGPDGPCDPRLLAYSAGMPTRLRRAAAITAILVASALAACGTATSGRPTASPAPGATPTRTPPIGGAGGPSTGGPSTGGPGTTQAGDIVLEFAGDVHFTGRTAQLLDDPATAFGPITSVLSNADITMVNLETAITSRGTPQPKTFHF